MFKKKRGKSNCSSTFLLLYLFCYLQSSSQLLSFYFILGFWMDMIITLTCILTENHFVLDWSFWYNHTFLFFSWIVAANYDGNRFFTVQDGIRKVSCLWDPLSSSKLYELLFSTRAYERIKLHLISYNLSSDSILHFLPLKKLSINYMY